MCGTLNFRSVLTVLDRSWCVCNRMRGAVETRAHILRRRTNEDDEEEKLTVAFSKKTLHSNAHQRA